MLTIRVNASRQINQGVEFEWFVQWVERLHGPDFTVGLQWIRFEHRRENPDVDHTDARTYLEYSKQ
ncbi:MAG: hypothetical protein AUK52_05645 [Comamonadaceae bacterium CG2_30_60_41]|nr:MAG: hypothetical protein AUK52_05645 [Comamonadaceae bacterium CG2_30_60_41]PIW09119.1 MAG: hypothetical protein COW39_06710 [Comamonadaceae bacterium CG17_big_fil_post_rev_8_21_14_2_50_60_13]